MFALNYTLASKEFSAILEDDSIVNCRFTVSATSPLQIEIVSRGEIGGTKSKRPQPSTFSPLKSTTLPIEEWHEICNDGSTYWKSVEVRLDTEIRELKIIDGKLDSPSKEVEGKGLESLLFWLKELKGETLLHVAYECKADHFLILDIWEIGGVDLRGLSRENRISLVDSILPSSISHLESLLFRAEDDVDFLRDGQSDEEFAYMASGTGVSILTFSLANYMEEYAYFLTNPRTTLTCRVLSKKAYPYGFEYGLGLLCPETGDDVFAFEADSEFDIEVDEMVTVETFLSLGVPAGEPLDSLGPLLITSPSNPEEKSSPRFKGSGN